MAHGLQDTWVGSNEDTGHVKNHRVSLHGSLDRKPCRATFCLYISKDVNCAKGHGPEHVRRPQETQ